MDVLKMEVNGKFASDASEATNDNEKLIIEVGQLYDDAMKEYKEYKKGENHDPETKAKLRENIFDVMRWYQSLQKYDEKYVWCVRCDMKHGINTKVAKKHPTKPIPIKCYCEQDHIYELIRTEKGVSERFFTAVINIGLKYGQRFWKDEDDILKELDPITRVFRCITCGKTYSKQSIKMNPWFYEMIDEYRRLGRAR